MKTKAHEAGNLGNPTDEGSIPGSNLLQATPVDFNSTPKCLKNPYPLPSSGFLVEATTHLLMIL